VAAAKHHARFVDQRPHALLLRKEGRFSIRYSGRSALRRKAQKAAWSRPNSSA
jgi:hypothetical protein